MEIDNVRREDAGTYMCTASNNVGTMSADEIDLRVLCKFFRDFFTTKDEPSFLKRYFIDHNLLLYAYGSNLTVRTNASFCLDLLGHPSVPSIFQWAFRVAKAMKVKGPNEKWPFSSSDFTWILLQKAFSSKKMMLFKWFCTTMYLCHKSMKRISPFLWYWICTRIRIWISKSRLLLFRFFTASPLEAKNFFRRTVIEVTLITFVKLFCFSLASLMKLS